MPRYGSSGSDDRTTMVPTHRHPTNDEELGNSSNKSSIEMGEEETTSQGGSVDEDVEGADSTEVCIDDLLGLSLGLPNDGIGPAPPEMGTTEPSQTPEELGSTTPSIDDDDIPSTKNH